MAGKDSVPILGARRECSRHLKGRCSACSSVLQAEAWCRHVASCAQQHPHLVAAHDMTLSHACSTVRCLFTYKRWRRWPSAGVCAGPHQAYWHGYGHPLPVPCMHKQALALLAPAQVHVLARMEAVGMGLDLHSLLMQKLPLKAWLAKLEARAYKVWAHGCAAILPAVLCSGGNLGAPACASKFKEAAPRHSAFPWAHRLQPAAAPVHSHPAQEPIIACVPALLTMMGAPGADLGSLRPGCPSF